MKHTQGDWKAEWTHSESNIKKGWHIITGKYDDVINLPNGSEAQQTGELIVTAVNACKEINPDNPLNVAKVLPQLFEALKGLVENCAIDARGEPNYYAMALKAIKNATK